jgi:Mrp family chromosome partitioning ATPase
VRRSEIEEALERLDQVGVRLLGIALNRVTAKRRGTSYYNYEATTPVSESPRRVSRVRRFPPGTAPTGGTAP